MANKDLSIYVHIPFCKKKCLYCDFLSAKATEETREVYVQELLQEMQLQSKTYKDREIKTVFFGGGTPSLLLRNQIERIIDTLNTYYHMQSCREMTIEVNPATVDRKKLQCYKELGVNRISIGLQSANNRELNLLGRVHVYEEFLETYHTARAVGFTNINIDIMAAIPSQTMESYRDTLRKVTQLQPEHISAYSLIIEEGTPFYALYGNLECVQPHPNTGKIEQLLGEDEERKIYEYTKYYLEEQGYMRYEISNYAKRGFECEHNNVYWQRGDYLGFGNAASSMVDNVRWSSQEESVVLTKKEQMEEYMFLGLRRMEGISVSGFYQCFQRRLEEVYGGELMELQKDDLVRREGDWVRLTQKGIDISNYVFAKFL